MKTRWCHYSVCDKLDLTRSGYNQYTASHPNGLWMSSEKGLGSWFDNPNIKHDINFRYKHVLGIRLDEILVIKTDEDAERFKKRFGYGDNQRHEYNWVNVAKHYSGIYVAFSCVHTYFDCWDCESLVLWDLTQAILYTSSRRS